MTTPANVPVGTIIAYAAEPMKLPDNWRVCDGSSFGTTDYPELFAAIGYANGGTGSNMFQIPDLQGRFIRGHDTSHSRLPGNFLDWKTAAPTNPLQVTLNTMATEWHYTNKADAKSRMIDWHDSSTNFDVSTSETETRPINTYLHWVIKVLPFKQPKDDIPVGGIIPFGGSDTQRPANQFPSYIRCDGTPVTASSVPLLQKTVGNVFTNDPNPQSWYPPNLTGKFIRGVDPVGKNDPDFAKRHEAPNGAKRGIGTWQSYATAFKSPYVSVAHFSNLWHTVYKYDAHPYYTNLEDDGYFDYQTWQGGDSESRPVNAAAHYYINSVDAAGGGNLPAIFPVGGIIAIPGAPPPDPKTWLPCDGSTVPSKAFPALFAAIGYTWGQPGGTGSFSLPMLLGWFLRGADPNGSTPNGDPNWNSRYSLASGAPLTGAGSYQGSATGKPNGIYVNCHYPTSTLPNAHTGSGSTNQTAAEVNSSSQTFQLSATWDDETIPKTVVVKYYIRAA